MAFIAFTASDSTAPVLCRYLFKECGYRTWHLHNLLSIRPMLKKNSAHQSKTNITITILSIIIITRSIIIIHQHHHQITCKSQSPSLTTLSVCESLQRCSTILSPPPQDAEQRERCSWSSGWWLWWSQNGGSLGGRWFKRWCWLRWKTDWHS